MTHRYSLSFRTFLALLVFLSVAAVIAVFVTPVSGAGSDAALAACSTSQGAPSAYCRHALTIADTATQLATLHRKTVVNVTAVALVGLLSALVLVLGVGALQRGQRPLNA